MKSKFVQTKNVQRFLLGLSKVQERGAGEACLMVVKGEPGLGKTEIVEWWATQNNAVYLRAKKEWTPAWMMRELLSAMDVKDHAYRFEAMFRQAYQQLQMRDIEGQNLRQTFGVVIDEADHIVRNAHLLETLRDLSDMTEIPFILVGMGRIIDSLARFPQVASRVSQYVEFQRADLADVTKLATELCDVEIDAPLLAYVETHSNGLIREVMEALKSIERFGKKNEGAVTLEAMNGELLMNNRRTGKPIYVRA